MVCTATIADSHGASTETTATVTIGNSPPEITDVSLAPTDVFTDDTVTATASTIEPDGQPLTFQYAFYVDDVLVQDSASATLDGTVHFDKGQTIQVTVTADDGLDSDTASSELVSVRNSPPSAPEVSIEEMDESTCDSVYFDDVGWVDIDAPAAFGTSLGGFLNQSA